MEDGNRAGADVEPIAWIDGKPVSFDDAVAEAVSLLNAASTPVFGHLGADVEGAREAMLLAELVGGVVDHAASAALLGDLDAIRESGAMLTTPLEAATRADTVLLVGDTAVKSWRESAQWLARPARPHDQDVTRCVIGLLGSSSDAAAPPETSIIEVGPGLLPFLASLRACAKQRPVEDVSANALSATLLGAKFGVAMWSAAELEPLAIEAIQGLIRDLNETTRFSTLALPVPDNGLGVQTVCGWMTGFPMRTGFPHGAPEHDPWRYDARRLIATGEADCLLWVSSIEGGATAPAETKIVLCPRESQLGSISRVRFAVARPGVDVDGVLHDPRVGGFVAARGLSCAPREPTVAAVLAGIRVRLGGSPC